MKRNKLICEHVEEAAKLPPVDLPMPVMSRYTQQQLEWFLSDQPGPEETKELVQKLRACGLAEFEVKLIQQRVFEGKGFDDIVEEDEWVSRRSASYHFEQALKKLRKVWKR